MKQILLLIMSTTFLFSNGISGVAYFKFSDNAFSLSRTYFTYNNSISNELSFQFQTDIGQLTDSDEDPAEDSRYSAYLKKAQLDWLVNSDMKISMGLIGMNMFNIQEKTWGNRFISKSAMDKNKYSSSADLGLGISKDFGQLFVNFLMTNGEGYKQSSVDENSKVSLQLLYGEKRLDKNNGHNLGMVYSSLSDDYDIDTVVMGFFGGWSGNSMTLGAEYNTKEVESMSSSIPFESSIYSLYANYSINDNSSVFFRVDENDPDSNNSDDEIKTTWLGINWTPAEGLIVCPNVMTTDDIDNFAVNFQFKF
jgi:hypothetical protein